ncbi:MAG: hypothetical protein OQK75_03465 [Gammaproteobacteria bacterium]|nr:hypothetical protein [Gammaproteobacteria bacterium]MCW8986707.1 hypothetical protein [Gammaproteobacteria bacterium]MCW9032509.1 hypothetical protein [Gammaproteobacteria bacterium]
MRIFSDSQSGLSLIEAIIFILIISIGLTGIISVYLYTTKHSADTMLSLKTVELSQALMDEILSKGYDENTPVGGGCVAGFVATNCSSSTLAQATVIGSFGPNPGETRSRFDDIDDYHNLAYCGAGVANPPSPCAAGSCPASPNNFIDETEADISANYAGYSVCVQLSFAGNEMNNVALVAPTLNNHANVLTNDAKRIDLIIRDPLDARLTFTSYKANF